MLALRLLTAAVGIPLLLLAFWAGQPWLTVLIGVIVLIAAVEASELLGGAGLAPATGLVGLFGVLAVAIAAGWTAETAWLGVAWLGGLVVAALAFSLRAADGAAIARSWAGTLAATSYVATLSFLLLIATSVEPEAATGPLAEWLDAGRGWLLIVVLGVWSYDSAAYATGRAWGRGRFFNHISPNKTWTGALGGSLASIAAGALLGALFGRPLEGAGLGVLIALGAPVGDLAESALKRAAGVKDSGRLFPGHGGMLDRVDAFVVVAPLAWIYLTAVGLA
jgi:phosphatidate cytidylyltransferase